MDDGIGYGVVARRKRGYGARFGGFNSGMSGKGRHRWVAASAMRVARRTRAPRATSPMTAKHGTTHAEAAKSVALGADLERCRGDVTSQGDRRMWKFRSLLRSVLGPVVVRDNNGSVQLQSRIPRDGSTLDKTRLAKKAGPADAKGSRVPTLAQACLDELIKYIDCVEDPTVLQCLTPPQQEYAMRYAGGSKGIPLGTFQALCGECVEDAVVRGPQGDDAFVESLFPTLVGGVNVDLEELAATISDSDDDSDDYDLGPSASHFLWAEAELMRRFTGCRQLRSLCLFNAGAVSVSSLAQAAVRLPMLERLSIHHSLDIHTPVHAVCSAVAAMERLVFVSVSSCSWLVLGDTAPLLPLRGLKHLKQLHLDGVVVSDLLSPQSLRVELMNCTFPRYVNVKVSFLATA